MQRKQGCKQMPVITLKKPRKHKHLAPKFVMHFQVVCSVLLCFAPEDPADDMLEIFNSQSGSLKSMFVKGKTER